MAGITWEMVEKTVCEKMRAYKEIEDNLSKGIGLYGAGQFGQIMLDYMKDNNYKINCYLDSNIGLHGQMIGGIEIKNLDDFSGGVILITARRAIVAIKKLINNAYPVMAFEEWFAIKNIDKYEYVRNNVLAEDESKHILDTIIYEMLTNSNLYFSEIYSPEQYFCLKEFVEGFDECFVDIGAYTGDGIESFIWKKLGNFTKIYAFEPMSKQYNAMVKRVNRLVEEWGIEAGKIELIKAGVADIESNMEVSIEEDRISSAVFLNNALHSEKTEQVPVYKLDKYFVNNTVTFIKADIEGFEMRMLKGAEEVIKQNKPKLAICVYHKVNDIFDFVEYLGRIVPEYKFRLRHHSYNLTETVLYCNI
jgi:FkbM family methyltransferase